MLVFEGSVSSSYQNLIDGTSSHLEHKRIDLGDGKRDDPAPGKFCQTSLDHGSPS